MAEAEKARRSGSRSFRAFVLQFWHLVPAVDALVWGWHMDALCDHLEAVARGRIGKLVVNIPPGHAKSVLVSVLFPAWVWTWWPACQFLCGSYSLKLAVRDSLRCRVVVESAEYRERYMRPGRWSLRRDQNAKDNFQNTAGGERVSIGRGGVGRRAHVILLDDPNDLDTIHSEPEREATKLWIGQTISQRFVDARRPRLCCVQQRCHADDASAFLQAGGDAQTLRLSSEYDPDDPCRTFATSEATGKLELFWADPRRERGDLLFAARFTRAVLEAFKRPSSLGLVGYATQHQQKPPKHGKGGKLFPRSAWRFCETMPPAGDVERVVRRWDLAATEDGGDWTVGLKMARLTDAGVKRWGFTFLALDVVRAQLGPRGVRKLVKSTAELDGDEVLIVIPQDPAQAGKDQVADYQIMLEGYASKAERETGDKVTRAGIASAQVQAENVRLLRGPQWERFLQVCEAFPDDAVEDDDVDALSGAVKELALEPESTADQYHRAFADGEVLEGEDEVDDPLFFDD